MSIMRRSGLLAAAALLIAIAASAGMADGTLTINGKSQHLAYAYGWKSPDAFHKGAMHVHVLLSTALIPRAVIGDAMGLIELARQGKLTGVEVELASVNEIVTGNIYSSAFPNAWLSASGMHHFEKSSWTSSEVAGRLFMSEPVRWGPPNAGGGITYVYSATFKTTIAPPQKR